MKEQQVKNNEQASKNAEADRWNRNKVSYEYLIATGQKKRKQTDTSQQDKEFEQKRENMVKDATSGTMSLSELSSKYNMSEEYIKQYVYNTTGKSVKTKENTSNNKNAEKQQKEFEEKKSKMVDDAMTGEMDLTELANKYNMSEDYVQQYVYNTTGVLVKKKNKNNSSSNTNTKPTSYSKEYERQLKENSKKNKY